jgi:hypothetical protein
VDKVAQTFYSTYFVSFYFVKFLKLCFDLDEEVDFLFIKSWMLIKVTELQTVIEVRQDDKEFNHQRNITFLQNGIRNEYLIAQIFF